MKKKTIKNKDMKRVTTLKDLQLTVPGLRYLTEALPLSGGRAVKYLHASVFTSKASVLEAEYDRIEEALAFLNAPHGQQRFMQLQHVFYRLRDLSATFRIFDGPTAPDEVQLFEIKQFAIAIEELRSLLSSFAYADNILLPLTEVVAVLDPEKTGTAAFTLYDAYSPALAAARKVYRLAEEDERAVAYAVVEEAERQVLYSIREQLLPHLSDMRRNLMLASQLELRLAKAALARQFGMHRPHLQGEVSAKMTYRKLTHPQLAAGMAEQHKVFQPVDVDFTAGPQLITGANMSGKSVFLQTLALAQTLAQLGFFVPASEASIPLFDGVFLQAGDAQDALQGLSSFAAEMLRWDACMKDVQRGRHLLVLLDEPARTTNPTEGKALVLAMTDFCRRTDTMAVITTHYGGLGHPCPQWRVKGFDSSQMEEGDLRERDINALIDHQLIPDTEDAPPPEALRIAALLGVDRNFIDNAKTYI